MSDEEKKDLPQADDQKEIFFLPPLKMILAFFDKESRQREKKKKAEKKAEEKTVEKLIEKLSEKDK